MRSDEKLGESLVAARAWNRDPITGKFSEKLKRFETASLDRGKMSFSGNERNHLFFNDRGANFKDISGISGLDSPLDGRSFVVWDFDRDGWQDIALVSINAPVLQLFRNEIGSIDNDSVSKGNMLALRFVGGNTAGEASTQFGCRDGFGVKATVNFAQQKLIDELRCGEGLGAQNSSYLFFGMGDEEVADSISIQWPSGISQQIEQVRAGELITVYENSEESSDGSGFERSRYIREK